MNPNIINLSGIKALKPPASVFSDYFKFQEQTFRNAAYPDGSDVWADVVWEKENKYQTPQEPALLAKLSNCPIGYIPVLSTIERYMNEAHALRGQAMSNLDADGANSAFARWEKEAARYAAADWVRGNIKTEMEVNHLPVKMRVVNVILSPMGEVNSVSLEWSE